MTGDEAPVYRAIVDVLFDGAAEYRSDLTITVIEDALKCSDPPVVIEPKVLTDRLTQLHIWGNVDRDRDESWAPDLRSYELRAFVYNLSSKGEAAHEAVLGLEETLLRTIGLQRVALLHIGSVLGELVDQIALDTPDGDTVHNLAVELHRTFKTLTGNTGRFLQRVNHILNAPAVEIDEYLLFKVDTIHYLVEFTDHLEKVSDDVVLLFSRIDEMPEKYAAALEAGAKASGERIIDQAGSSMSWTEEAVLRIDGVRHWFVPVDGTPTGGQRLHRMVRRAVLGIGPLLDRVRDARLAGSGRASELLSLARKFTTAPNDEAAHALWHNEFGLAGARHFYDEAPQDGGPIIGDWWNAPAARHTIKLRAISANDQTGRARRTPNHGATKRFLAELARKRLAEHENAHLALVRLGRTKLSNIRRLANHATLELLAQLIAQVQQAPHDPVRGRRTALSMDGRLNITLADPIAGSAARISSPSGHWTLPDYQIHVRWTEES
ncbi:TIGR02677 family protein [Actinoalloteichus fjordicus]|uniref:TIGR02677 family protein n=1 Tax=Actinoalloteichus fjordicus TaxID=1612552 RepID=UPI00214F7FC8|nr:TIGR02677 family protein [Actinoalloteichus fjordicus]